MPTREQIKSVVDKLMAAEKKINTMADVLCGHDWADPIWEFNAAAIDAVDSTGWLYWFCYENEFGRGGLTVDDKSVTTIDDLFDLMGI